MLMLTSADFTKINEIIIKGKKKKCLTLFFQKTSSQTSVSGFLGLEVTSESEDEVDLGLIQSFPLSCPYAIAN